MFFINHFNSNIFYNSEAHRCILKIVGQRFHSVTNSLTKVKKMQSLFVSFVRDRFAMPCFNRDKEREETKERKGAWKGPRATSRK